jgi:hypothetical protein
MDKVMGFDEERKGSYLLTSGKLERHRLKLFFKLLIK